jgi:hypothetical protein
MQGKCQLQSHRRQKLGVSDSASPFTVHHTWKLYSTAQQEQMFVLILSKHGYGVAKFYKRINILGPQR